MTKKLIIGLLVAIFLISGAAGYVILQPSEDTVTVTANTSNLAPEAVLEKNNYTNPHTKREICNACHGTGWSDQIVCPECRGFGVLNCTACHGTGKCPNGTICPCCHGTGQIICPECNGTGGTRCKFCHGDGYYDPGKGDKKLK
jgi:DnaJ-class molecular chaperone